jgi:hypothetical protein
MSANVKVPALRMNPKEHFLVSGIKRSFDLSVLVGLYAHILRNIGNINKGENLEYTIGRSTVIYSIDEYNTINLITGWSGNRKKKAM